MIDAPSLLTAEVHAASEFNDNYRGILDEVRQQGVARVRDKDGRSVVLLPESRMVEYAQQAFLAQIAVALVTIAARRDSDPSVLAESRWPWLRWLDADDRGTFFAELRQNFIDALATGDVSQLQRDLRDWQVTANVLRDEKARGVLLGRNPHDEYVDAPRPAADPTLASAAS